MKLRLVPLVAVTAFWFCCAPVHVLAETPSQHDAAEEQGEFPWHLINSVLFGAGLLYAVWKYSPRFFNARSEDIQKAIKEATGLKIQADFRHSEIDRKMASLPAEIERLRQQARIEMEREGQRRKEETLQTLKKIEDSLQAEVALTRAEGIRQIQNAAALRALQSAESQLRERAQTGQSESMTGDFLRLVADGGKS